MSFGVSKKLAIFSGIKSIGSEKFDPWLINYVMTWYGDQDELFDELYVDEQPGEPSARTFETEQYHVGNFLYMVNYRSYKHRTVTKVPRVDVGYDEFSVSEFRGYPIAQEDDDSLPDHGTSLHNMHIESVTQYLNVEGDILVWSDTEGDELDVKQRVMNFCWGSN